MGCTQNDWCAFSFKFGCSFTNNGEYHEANMVCRLSFTCWCDQSQFCMTLQADDATKACSFLTLWQQMENADIISHIYHSKHWRMVDRFQIKQVCHIFMPRSVKLLWQAYSCMLWRQVCQAWEVEFQLFRMLATRARVMVWRPPQVDTSNAFRVSLYIISYVHFLGNDLGRVD